MAHDIVLTTINAKWIHPSLALRLLKANLGEFKERAIILEFALRQPLQEKVSAILNAGPCLLALSVSIWNHLATIDLLKTLENQWPREGRPYIILGGPEVSFLPVDAEIFKLADYVIRGEGEESFYFLCKSLLGAAAVGPGAAVRSERAALGAGAAAARAGKKATFLEADNTDLNKINYAYNLYTDEDLSKKLTYVEASRGCPFSCEFCQAGMQEIREFPIENFLAEMEALIRRGGQHFKFLDRTFNSNINRAIIILEFFLQKIISGSPIVVHFEMVPMHFPLELKSILSKFPPKSLRLEVGIQTFNPETSLLIKRPSLNEESLKFLFKDTNTIIHADLIIGLPGEDLSSFRLGLDKLMAIMADYTQGSIEKRFEIQIGILKCLPGTPINRHEKEFSFLYSSLPPYEMISTSTLSKAELDSMKNFSRFWELIVNRNHFPDLTLKIFPKGESAFDNFYDLSKKLLLHFGSNWGIDRNELREFLQSFLSTEKT